VDDLDAVIESDTCNHRRQLICAFEPPPGFRRGDNQDERARDPNAADGA